ncbi:AMP nucleosidase [Salmonella enterica subsp. enterica serovar Haifa]|nr:AMP nucleosidase [Salmonella enterica subsp. enterica serovar Haifa]ECG3597059.1 AMP nucleosidase [Salmonella enterica subsp. enterica serovar Haifa]
MLPSETMIWQPEFTDKTLSRKPGAVHPVLDSSPGRKPQYRGMRESPQAQH